MDSKTNSDYTRGYRQALSDMGASLRALNVDDSTLSSAKGSEGANRAGQIFAQRQQRGWSQAQLAEKMTVRGVTWHQSTVYKVEAGRRKLLASEWEVLEQVFSLSAMDKMLAEVRASRAMGKGADGGPRDA